ncbi:MAG TPA: hypothetical protein VFY31_01695 [Macromonas sp.]|nr:hypothetical protein [Macromonas sp.]
MSLFETPVARIKRISEEIKRLEARLEGGRLSLEDQRGLHAQRAGLIKTLDELELRTRKPVALASAR